MTEDSKTQYTHIAYASSSDSERNMNNWVLSEPAKKAATITYENGINTIDYTGVPDWEVFNFPVKAKKGQSFTFSFSWTQPDVKSESGVSVSIADTPLTHDSIGRNVIYLGASKTESKIFTISGTATADETYVSINLGGLSDGINWQFKASFWQDFGQNPSKHEYMGWYSDFTALDSNDPSFYGWSLIKGADGSQGTPGKPGTDGKTPYLHTAYSWSADGTDRFMTVYPNENLLPHSADFSGQAKNHVEILSSDEYNGHKVIHGSTTIALAGNIDTIRAKALKPSTSTNYVASFIAWSSKVGTKINNHWFNPNTTASAESGQGGKSIVADGTIPLTLTTTPTKYWIKWTQTATDEAKTLILGRINAGDISDVYIVEPTLTEGTESSPYTPSPLDDPEGAYPKFIGTYTDYTTEDSTDPAKYTWAQYVDRSKQKLAIHPKTGADIIGAVGAKLVDLTTSGLGNDVSIKLGDYKVYYIDTDGNKSDMVDVPAFTANPSIKPTAIKISQATMSLTEGGNKVLSATITPDTATIKDVTYTSSAPEVAKVSATGEVTAVTEGKADITVASKMVPTITGKCAVTVTPAS